MREVFKLEREVHPEVLKFRPMVKAVAETFGNKCEVVLHDFSDTSNTIVAIENGHVTGRSIGSPLTEESLKKVNKGNTDKDIYNYTGKSTDGRILKSSTVFIKDEEGYTVGSFCINLDITELTAAASVLKDLMKINNGEEEKEQVGTKKINDVLTDLVDQTIKAYGKPIAYLSKEDKVKIVKELEKHGAFLIKGAIDHVAKILCVSRYTIYNYLDEIR
jgi:predicted transcriptional regulator YheO